MRNTPLAVVVAATLLTSPAWAVSTLDVSTSCVDDGPSIRVRLFFLDDPEHPSPLPTSWVGYDLFRRPLHECPYALATERVNAEILPRPVSNVHEVFYTDTPPSPAGSYQYFAMFVDANRQPVTMNSCGECNLDYSGRFGAVDYGSCPQNSVPVGVGKIVDWGWTLALEPCPELCFPGGTIGGPREEDLRPLAGTNTVVRVYGRVGCCSVEGPGLYVENFVIAPGCGPTPNASASWGRVKAIYR